MYSAGNDEYAALGTQMCLAMRESLEDGDSDAFPCGTDPPAAVRMPLSTIERRFERVPKEAWLPDSDWLSQRRGGHLNAGHCSAAPQEAARIDLTSLASLWPGAAPSPKECEPPTEPAWPARDVVGVAGIALDPAAAVQTFASEPTWSWSRGSLLHAQGTCKPCGFLWSTLGCAGGQECQWCHLHDKGWRKDRRKEKRADFGRMRRQPNKPPTECRWSVESPAAKALESRVASLQVMGIMSL